jgi:sterol desaturase/sphingolipid hydroxylase (fatty acid hydroxylase superfamily)
MPLRQRQKIQEVLRRLSANDLLASAMRIEALIAFGIPLTYALLRAIETRRPGVHREADAHWQWLGWLFFALLGAVNQTVAALAKTWLPLPSLFDGAALGTVGGVVVGYLLISLGNALLHRAYHRSDLLWRYVHRYHHRPRRLDVAGVMYQTPLEMTANALLFTAITVYLLGLPPLPTMLCAWIAAFYGMFQHLNSPTPRWLGWLIQRPEAHSLHHRRHRHAWNYSDLPLWDALLGTWRNPLGFETDLGIAAGDDDTQRLRRHE